MADRKKLSDILQDKRDSLSRLYQATAAAAEYAPLPPGTYIFRIVSGELFTSKKNSTPGYKLRLEVTEGGYVGRHAWTEFWLTPAALPMTKRDLQKIGVTNLEQLEQPLPSGILIRGKLALRHDDDGNESNRLVRFECVGIEPPDAFAPEEHAGAKVADQGDATHHPSRNGSTTNGEAPSPDGVKHASDATATDGGAAR
jgi:hypothetical protein